MHPSKIQNIISLNDEDRYQYFIRKVTDYGEVWGIYNDGWAILSDNQQNTIIPFWPEEEFALRCCSEQWQGYSPRIIPLKDFMDKWLPGMKTENNQAGVFYVLENQRNILIDPDILLADLMEEFKY